MRTGRPKQPLNLTEEEQERLESLAHRARSQPMLARRARVVLACAEGSTTDPWPRNCGARWVWSVSGAPVF
jgi:hypothetical protein